MTEILNDLSPASLASTNKADLYNFFQHFEQASLMDFERRDGITSWRCPHPFFWSNSVLSAPYAHRVGYHAGVL